MAETRTLNSIAYEKRRRDEQAVHEHSREAVYARVLRDVRAHVSQNHAEQLAMTITDSSGKDRLERIIREYLTDTRARVQDLSMEELVEDLYQDMAGMGFLEEFIQDPDVEEINAFAWDNIEIVTGKGRRRLRDRGFVDPVQAEDTVKKMIRAGGLTLDASTPVVDSYITEGVRASAMIPPVTDKKKGVTFSIRKQNRAAITKDELLREGTATEDMLDFLALCLNHGVSIQFSGKAGSGKTTDIAYILNRVDPDKRIFTIEETRELHITPRIIRGKPADNIIYTCTRPSEKESSDIDYDDLLRASLRYHPDILALAEMRGAEAMTVVESARTGHTVITSLHANNAHASYGRILSMCQMSGTTIPTEVLIRFVAEAFPIAVFTKQFPDGTRRMTEIVEATGVRDFRVQTRTLWRYDPDAEKHVRKKRASFALGMILRDNDATADEVRRFVEASPGDGKGG